MAILLAAILLILVLVFFPGLVTGVLVAIVFVVIFIVFNVNLPDFIRTIFLIALIATPFVLALIFMPQIKGHFRNRAINKKTKKYYKREPKIEDTGEIQRHIKNLLGSNILSDRKLYSHFIPEAEMNERVYISPYTDVESGEKEWVYYTLRDGRVHIVVPLDAQIGKETKRPLTVVDLADNAMPT